MPTKKRVIDYQPSFADSLAIPGGAAAGKVLTSDGSGLSTWGIIENPILNPSFEYDTVGSAPAIWLEFLQAEVTGEAFAVSETWASSGKKSLHVKAKHAANTTEKFVEVKQNAVAQRIPVKAGDVWSIQVKLNIISAATAGGFRIFTYYYKKGSESLVASGTSPNGALVGLTGEQTLNFTNFTIPAEAELMGIAIVAYSNVSGATYEFYMDKIIASPGPEVKGYFDGDSEFCAWGGVAGQSISIAGEVAYHNDPRIVRSGIENVLQPGVVAAADWKLSSISVNSGTGVIKFRAGGVIWVENEITGALVRCNVASKEWTVTPPNLPLTTHWVCVGIELQNSEGRWNLEPTVSANTDGAEENTEATALASSPAVAAHKTRIADIPLLNTAGVYSLGTARDRRPWAKGYFDETFASNTEVVGETKTEILKQRIEFSGKGKIRVNLSSSKITATTVTGTVTIRYTGQNGGGTIASVVYPVGGWPSINQEGVAAPAAGSYLVIVELIGKATGTLLVQAPVLIVSEDIRPIANNGTS